jgi:ankyrin repeat protein
MSGLLGSAAMGDIKTVKRLLEGGASITERDRHGNSALLCAALYCRLSTVNLHAHVYLLRLRSPAAWLRGSHCRCLGGHKTHAQTHAQVQWLLAEGDACITDTDQQGTLLLQAT